MEVVSAPPRPPETLEPRIRQQARDLQALIFQFLLLPPDPLDPSPDLELSRREVRVLFLLWKNGQMTMTDLASALQSPLSTVTRMIDRLEGKGLVERDRSDQDRRIVLIRPAEKAMLLHASCSRHQLALAERMLEPLTPGEREILLELMDKLILGLRSLPLPRL